MATQNGNSGSNRLGSFSSKADTAQAAIAEISAQFDPEQTAFLLVFAAHRYESADLEKAFETHWAGLPVFGCTTAGEIGSAGYAKDSIVVINFPKSNFEASEILYDFGKQRTLVELAEKTKAAQRTAPASRFPNRFGCLLVDGTSKLEDIVVAAIDIGLENKISVFGGSAGDGMEFNETKIFSYRRAHNNAALLLVVSTDYEMRGIGFDHFEPTEERIVVTGALPEERLLTELNGSPAAAEYARLIGKDVPDITPSDFAANPMLVRSGTDYHVRSIKEFTPAGYIEMLAAIDYGLIFHMGRGKELLQTLVAELAAVTLKDKKPEMIVGFDCVLRKLEIEHKDLSDDVSEILSQFNVIGFNTYGEQYSGVHVNQTFVGVALFAPA